jgi:DNA invertase Pin-like site-specific DNA recombinase
MTMDEKRRIDIGDAGDAQRRWMPGPGEPARLPVIGYASCAIAASGATGELRQQTEAIAAECKALGLELLEVVGERRSSNGKGLDRPGLTYVLERLSAGEAAGLVVVEMSRITQSVGELGSIIEWLLRLGVRLIASADSLDTNTEGGRLAAGLLVDVSRWERNRISERTRHGLEAARMTGRVTGRPAVADDPDLRGRIAQMRAEGMTLQAIADRLNEEGVPTVRGGAKWRHSSVQAAAGYHRVQRSGLGVRPSRPLSAGDQSVG